jgi:hypothetical protein
MACRSTEPLSRKRERGRGEGGVLRWPQPRLIHQKSPALRQALPEPIEGYVFYSVPRVMKKW